MKNLEHFYTRFNEIYDGLYNGIFTAPEGSVSAFDAALAGDPDFKADVLEFNAYRRDIVSSDREAAAFWIAWKEVN